MSYEPGRINWSVEVFKESGKPYGFKDKAEALKYVKRPELNVRFIRLFFPDLNGNINDFFIPVSEFESALDKGKGFDGSSVKGMTRIEESDLNFYPDPTTLRVLPFEYEGKTRGLRWRNAICFGNIMNPDGSPFEGDSRYILKRSLEKLKDVGANHFYVGNEMEFFLVNSLIDPKPLDTGGYFRGGSYGDLRSEIQILLEAMGIPTEYDHHEVAESQHEIDFVYDDALMMADKTFVFKYIVKKIARENGVYATFAPKPFIGINGSGMHTHMSIWKDDKNLFYGEKENLGLSSFGFQFLSGLLHYLPDIMLVTNSWLNSYERLVPGFEAPTLRAVDMGNRSSCVRIPAYDNSSGAKRIELRNPDPACNVYLAFSGMLSAGLKGIQEGRKDAMVVDQNLYKMDEAERKARGIEEIPGKFEQAYKIAVESVFFKEAMGYHIAEMILAEKQIELEEYQTALMEFSKKTKEKISKQQLHAFNIDYSRGAVL